MERPLPHLKPTDRFVVGDLLKPTDDVSASRRLTHLPLRRRRGQPHPRRMYRRSGRIAARRAPGDRPVGKEDTGRARQARAPRAPTGCPGARCRTARVPTRWPPARSAFTPSVRPRVASTGARPSPPGRTRDRRTPTADGGGGVAACRARVARFDAPRPEHRLRSWARRVRTLGSFATTEPMARHGRSGQRGDSEPS